MRTSFQLAYSTFRLALMALTGAMMRDNIVSVLSDYEWVQFVRLYYVQYSLASY